MAKLGFGMLMVMQNEWPKAAEDIVALPRDRDRSAGTRRAPPIILTNVSLRREPRRGARARVQVSRPEMAVDRRPLPFLRRPSRHRQGLRELRQDGARPTPRSAKAPRPGKKATDFYVSIQIVGTPDDCLEKIAELQRLTGLDHLVTEYSFGAMPHEEAELNMRLFADKVLPMLQRDPAFAGTGVPATAPAPVRPAAGAPVRPGLSVTDLHHPRAPGAIHSGAKGINSDPRRWHGITGGGDPERR